MPSAPGAPLTGDAGEWALRGYRPRLHRADRDSGPLFVSGTTGSTATVGATTTLPATNSYTPEHGHVIEKHIFAYVNGDPPPHLVQITELPLGTYDLGVASIACLGITACAKYTNRGDPDRGD